MSINRARLSQEESRFVALEAARALLIEAGPQAVTLKAVAGRIDRTHANLLHHFGSAAGLQASLATHIAARVAQGVVEAVARSRTGEADPGEIVDRIFDAFDKEGAGALAAWMILSGNEDALDPVLKAIELLVDQLAPGAEGRPLRESTLMLLLMAAGESLVGGPVAKALHFDRGKAREIARAQLISLVTLAKPDVPA